VLIHELVEGNARRAPGDLAWQFGERRTTWGELEKRTARIAANLAVRGFRAGDRIALFSENSDTLAELFFALARCGVIAVPINPRSVLREVEFILSDVGARGLFVSAKLAPRLAAAPGAPARLDVDLLFGAGEGHGCPVDVSELHAPAPPVAPLRDADPLRSIKYTSGTTGTPKGCISSQRQFLCSLQSYLIRMPFQSDDRCLLALPMTAGVGIYLLTAYVYMGLPTVLHDRFDADCFLDEIERSRITRFYAVPTMISALVNAQSKRPRDCSSLRYAGYGGSPAAFALIRRGMETLGCGFYQTFGSSETGGFVTCLMPEDHRLLVRDNAGVSDSAGVSIMPCGRELQGVGLRLVDDSGKDVPEGEIGEIWVRSDSTMTGYWNHPEHTAEALSDGWLKSGDLGVRDRYGFISVVDRKKDMIISGGFNVYSSEVESVIQRHPGVAKVAVVGRPDPHWGESVVAFVVRHAGAICSDEELKLLCERDLAGFKRPQNFFFVEGLPETSTGKIRKAELRREAIALARSPGRTINHSDSPGRTDVT